MTYETAMAWCGMVFVVATLPQVVEGFGRRVGGVSPWFSLPTFMALCVQAHCAFRIGLPAAGWVWLGTGCLWGVILWQRVHYGAPVSRPQGCAHFQLPKEVGAALLGRWDDVLRAAQLIDHPVAGVVIEVGVTTRPAAPWFGGMACTDGEED